MDREEYNAGMPRAALFTLLVASLLSGPMQAQRAAGTAARPPVRSGFGGHSGSARRFFPRSRFLPNGFPGYGGFGAYFLPYDETFGYDQADAEAETNGPPPRVMIPSMPEPPVPKAQVIEIPGTAKSAAAKALPPTIFILANGDRLEATRFLLTADLLSVTVDRRQRTLPIAMLDINATISTNHERGIDLRIPDDRNEISLSF